MLKIRSGAGVLGVMALLAGCGLSPSVPTTVSASQAVRAADESDHAQVNLRIKDVLTRQWAFLLSTADANHDGAIAAGEYAGRDAEVSRLFLANFDANQDGTVTAAEYQAALAGTKAVEAYHHLAEARMEAAIEPYMADKDFDLGEMREYMTKSLGLTGDWPYLAKVFAAMDLNQDDKLLSGPGEGSAFVLMFVKQQLERSLKMPASKLDVR